MFGQPYKLNRRMTPKEFEQELIDAKIWKRRVRHYINDKPDYNLPVIEPLVNFVPRVNFQINFKD